MTAAKIEVAITLSPDLLSDIRARVAGGEVRSVSAFIQQAVQGQLAAEADFDGLTDQMLAATGGPATADARGRLTTAVRAGPANFVFIFIAILGLIFVRGRAEQASDAGTR